MHTAAEILAQRHRQRIAARNHVLSPTRPAIEGIADSNILSDINTNNTSIELPGEIAALITGSDYWVRAKTNRYKKLIREGYLPALLQLVEIAGTKGNPAHWFATAASKAEWSRTLDFLAKLTQVEEVAVRVAAKIGTEVTRFIYQQVWAGTNVERWAAWAAETGRHKAKYFTWLCRRESVARTAPAKAS